MKIHDHVTFHKPRDKDFHIIKKSFHQAHEQRFLFSNKLKHVGGEWFTRWNHIPTDQMKGWEHKNRIVFNEKVNNTMCRISTSNFPNVDTIMTNPNGDYDSRKKHFFIVFYVLK